MPANLREVDDDVGALGRSQQQRVLVHVADVEAGRVGDPGGRLLAVDDDRGRQEAALGADLDPVGTGGAVVGVDRRRGDDRVGLGRGELGRLERDLGRAGRPCVGVGARTTGS